MQIAIDGPSASGKSTVAKALAQRLGYIYIDSGAMYRACGLFATRQGISLDNEQAVVDAVANIVLDIKYINGSQHIFLNNDDVTTDVRTAEAGAGASAVARFPKLREKIVEMCRRMAQGQNIIMDGRDIGTVVFPDADVKIYLDASVEARAKRRVEELAEMGQPTDFEDISLQITQRDHQDMNREASPLKVADDAVIIDTSCLSKEETLEAIIKVINERK
ncbi:MAG: (d)CMP kinase [Defluviitaleaceae bacterium]|nr:(d)CMP kinase [Defluviitaleaceae bacterium]